MTSPSLSSQLTSAEVKPSEAMIDSPTLPAEYVGLFERKLRARTPRNLLAPLTGLVNGVIDLGLFGTSPLQTHVVMCGFPRSGSTLCQLMVEACVKGVRTFGRERPAYEIVRTSLRNHRYLFSKWPRDIYFIEDIRKFYASRRTNVKFVLFNRDPRAVLTSHHVRRPDDYYVSVTRWREIYPFWNWAKQASDVTTIRYEDLVTEPESVQKRLAELIGWEVTRPFADFYQAVPRTFDAAALNGVRPLSTHNIERWRDPKYTERLRSLIQTEMPELCERLMEFGYEDDDRWADPYRTASRAA